ncbi:MAG: putative histidine kinase, classic [Frankiales bacterium]|jgi:PAS domain S-box-containing protein|nr:putative histidine kinase, classic [Frankiales bacterium]
MVLSATTEDERDLLAQVVQVSADAILTQDLDGCILSWNPAAERLYGCLAEQAVGHPAAEVLTAETAADLEVPQLRARAGERVERFESWHRRTDGRHVAVSVTVSPLRERSGRVTGTATSVEDTTERIRLDADLEDVHRTLENQHEALRRSNRDLEQFAYVASHDLSEPLRVITGYIQLIEKRYGELFDARGSRYLEHVLDGSDRMRTLIDDLLEYSRFLRAPATPVRVDLTRLAQDVVERIDSAAVEVQPLPDVWADTGSVMAVLTNLIGNSLKFAAEGVDARVVVSAEVQRGRVVLHVDDNGIGIEAEYRERVFRMFQRLHVREDYPGTGIGLAIVQQVAENHGGRAWVEPSSLGGCRFSITLPAAPGPRPQAVPA